MLEEGQIVLFRFPTTDLSTGKLRPGLVLKRLPGRYDDWLLCMISSRVTQYVADFDELMMESEEDYPSSGLKVPSVIRIGRLAVVAEAELLGPLGVVDIERLIRIHSKLARWIAGGADEEKTDSVQ